MLYLDGVSPDLGGYFLIEFKNHSLADFDQDFMICF